MLTARKLAYDKELRLLQYVSHAQPVGGRVALVVAN
jgi:hypothetical protein